MCGITGFCQFRRDNSTPEWAETGRRMGEALAHRGPDDDGLWQNRDAVLVHRRLAVIDPENGKQPMVRRLGAASFAIAYNGELYNTEALRRELSAAGHRFTGHSDTEVVLHGYMEWGEGCVEKFNGIFAFAVWEQRRERCSSPGTGSA